MGEDIRKGRRKERKEKEERERLRRIGIEKALGRIKGSGEVWKCKEYNLFVVVYFYYYFVYWYIVREVVCDKCFGF